MRNGYKVKLEFYFSYIPFQRLQINLSYFLSRIDFFKGLGKFLNYQNNGGGKIHTHTQLNLPFVKDKSLFDQLHGTCRSMQTRLVELVDQVRRQAQNT